MTLLELLQLMRKRLALVIALPVIFAVLLAGYKYVGSSLSYTAKTRVYVNRSQIYESGQGDSMVALAQASINDVSLLFNSDEAWWAARDSVGLTEEELHQYSIVPSVETGANIINLEVSGPDGETAAKVANAITEYVADNAPEIMSIESVTILSSAFGEATEAVGGVSTKSLLKYAIVGFIGGLFLAIVVIIIQDMFDNRVRSADEASALLGLPVIGRFPVQK